MYTPLESPASTTWQVDSSVQGGSFASVTQAFEARVAELRQLTNLRIEDSAKGLFQQDLQGLEASVRALEKNVGEIRAFIEQESETIPKMRALLEACSQQSEQLQGVASRLPSYLPGTSGRAADAASDGPRAGILTTSGKQNGSRDAEEGAAKEAGGKGKKKVQVMAPPHRWYVTQGELASVSSYMLGRLTLDKVNAAIDEAVGRAEARWKLMCDVKGGGGRMPTAARKAALDLLHNVATKDSVRGQHWFLESDLKDGTALKLDKTGRGILTLLRHLGRIQEVRASSEAHGAITVYTLAAPPGMAH